MQGNHDRHNDMYYDNLLPYENDENDFQKSDEDEPYIKSSRRKREKRDRVDKEMHKKISVNRRIVNKPATLPHIQIVDGEERMFFKFYTKVSESAMSTMPRQMLDENEFCVRFDLDTVDITKLNDKFKADNCVYPRANCDKEDYKGLRWGFESDFNKLAWQFVSLNPVLLYGKKGLIQRAVDSYRKINKDNKNRRVMKQDKMVNGMMRRRHSDLTPTTVNIFWAVRGSIRRCRVRVDIENVNYEKIDDEFKVKYSVFEDEFDDTSFGLERWESSNTDNELAVKIAYLNVDNTSFWNCVKANDKVFMLKKAVEAYKELDEYESEEEDDERLDYSEIVGETLDKVYNDYDYEDNFFFLDSKHP